MSTLLMVLMLFSALLLILLVLIQRGKGGGLAGALGGMGGQSAFGTKAGDVFTRITIGLATVWIILCLVAVKSFSSSSQRIDRTGLGGEAPVQEGFNAPAEKSDSADSTSPTDKPTDKPADAPAK